MLQEFIRLLEVQSTGYASITVDFPRAVRDAEKRFLDLIERLKDDLRRIEAGHPVKFSIENVLGITSNKSFATTAVSAQQHHNLQRVRCLSVEQCQETDKNLSVDLRVPNCRSNVDQDPR